MTKSVKRTLFYSAVAVFLILSYVVILYAQGYKYSFSERKFFKTGAIYLKVNTDSDVYLNNKFLGNTSFFGNSYRIEGLLPGKYTIKVMKDDYSSWQKTAIVEEGLVNEFSKILLLPQDEKGVGELNKEIAEIFPTPTPTPTPAAGTKPTPTPTPSNELFTLKKGVLSTTDKNLMPSEQTIPPAPDRADGQTGTVASNVKNFVVSKDKNRLAWWTLNNELWVMWLNDANYQPYHKKGDKELIIKFSEQIKKAAWFRDEDHLILDSTSSPQVDFGRYRIIEIDTRGGINTVRL